MRLTPSALLLTLLSSAAGVAADELHERQLDQDVQELRRQIEAQSRRIDQLERSMPRTSGSGGSAWMERTPSPGAEAPPWLAGSNWERIRPGMSAAEVTKILGAATSERAGDAESTLLLYALEVQEGVFLAGRVEMRDGKVIAVQKPELR